MKILITLIFCMSSLGTLAANKSKSPLLIAIIEEIDAEKISVETKSRQKQKLTFNKKTKITYVGYDGAKQEVKAGSCILGQVKDGLITSMYVTPAIGKELVFPTEEMVKMTPPELFKLADLNKNGRVCYIEFSKTIQHSLKHGPTKFLKSDADKSGALNPKEFAFMLGKTRWWVMSRKTPEQWFKSSDEDKNNVLSIDELAVLLGSKAHIDIFFKRADTNKSRDIDPAEATKFIKTRIFSK